MDMQREQLEAREWELVDRIVVGSQFVADGLVGKGVDRSKIIVVPYGVDLNRFSWVKRRERENQNDPLRVLFVGRVSVMKGIPSLLHALSVLGPQKVQARLVGGSAIKAHRIEEFRGVANFVGHVPRSSILDHYRWADVLCFPSITEGSAAVTYEALATGLPVITTPNAGSIVRDGLDGFIVPIRSPEKLAEALQRYADDPALLAAHQEQLRSGRERAGLECYKRDIVKVVEDLGC
ncbi:glycosyltransferase family 4 protein [Ectothiorhodospira shaposhnikovii]|uniref:glycosyltransferase family 4 protein n=1 Tax=Ectothiorhodospira shaposhnikovii TaxID=1054 RepID=UPI00399F74BD